VASAVIAGLLLTLAVYAGALAAWTAAYAFRGRGPTPRHAAVALVLQSGLALHALWRLATLTGSSRPPDLAVAVGYVIASVLVLPLAAGSVTPLLDGRRSVTTNGWDAGALSFASAATVVVAARIDATWP
jgi:hypothetical protein